MTWISSNGVVDAIPDDATGFVYEIVNLTNGRRYIGKKLFKFKRTKQVKKKKVKVLIESDWKEYWSSSNELKDDVKKLGKENFQRRIIRICYSKSECNYWEAFYQFEYGVLLDDSYNGHIMCRVRKNRVLNGRKT